MTGLVLYDAACRALAAAVAVDEVKEIRIQAIAMESYARQAKDQQLLAAAWALRKRAERRLGELMKLQAETIGLAKPWAESRVIDKPNSPPTLDEAGIDKNLAHRARAAAACSEEEFEAMLAEGREKIAAEADRVDRRIYNAGRRRATQATPAFAAPGTYGCIVIDPPWPMEKIEREVRPNQVGFEYPTMTEDELAEFDLALLAGPDCHLFCWTTQRFLPMALRLVAVWGHRYVCTFVWHKSGGFQPHGLPQYNCEFIVYARAGSPRFVDTKAFPTCFEAPRREHSRKPDEFYDLIRRVTAEPRIDVFSREPREGFDQYGNEVARFGKDAA